MKLPRWLVIAMLTTSVLSVLAAAGWWWVTWPERTARAYLDSVVASGIKEEIHRLYPVPQQYLYVDPSSSALLQSRLEKWDPSVSNLLHGSQVFIVKRIAYIPQNDGRVVSGHLVINVDKGKVVPSTLMKDWDFTRRAIDPALNAEWNLIPDWVPKSETP